MAALAPSVAAVRLAVRRCLTEHLPAADSPRGNQPAADRGPVLVACSGGPDSLALAAAARYLSDRGGWPVGLVTVDHGLQTGSAERAARVAAWARAEGFDPVLVSTVDVAGRPGGPEAAARDARYQALRAAARRCAAPAVLLGHTRDDQAETVLLALARGAGPRGLAGMPRCRISDGVRLLRPLLDVSRADTAQACANLSLRPWHDPHNADPRYARARVRAALPALVDALGPDVVTNLARTATLVAADAAVLDALADEALADGVLADAAPADAVLADAAPADGVLVDAGLSVPALAKLAPAIRTRVLHRWAGALGAPGAALSYRHVLALDALVTGWHGQGPTALPGGIQVARRADRLVPVVPS